MKLITAEELIAAPNGTVFTTQKNKSRTLLHLLVKVSNSDTEGVINCRNLLQGKEAETYGTKLILNEKNNYYIYETQDLVYIEEIIYNAIFNLDW